MLGLFLVTRAVGRAARDSETAAARASRAVRLLRERMIYFVVRFLAADNFRCHSASCMSGLSSLLVS